MVIDADLYSRASHIWMLIEEVHRSPGVAMACASSLQNTPDIFGRSPWSYYDSYALLDQQNWLGITGALVPVRDLQDRAQWMANRPVNVRAAFGGIAVLQMATVQTHNLRWDGSGCEHWKFCIDAKAGGQVLPASCHAFGAACQPRRWSEAIRIAAVRTEAALKPAIA